MESTYSFFLMVSGVIMIFTALIPRLDGRSRAANAVLGALLGGYGYYLSLHHDGTYFVFYFAFILPFLLIGNTLRILAENRNKKQYPNQQQAHMQQQQANQAQYAAWQARAQAQNGQQNGAPAQSRPQSQGQFPSQGGQAPVYQQQQGFPAQLPSLPEPSVAPASAFQPNDAPGL